jgi:hypothetical protein
MEMAKVVKFCSACGNRVSDGTSYCPFCGAKLPADGQSGAQTVSISAPAQGKPFVYDQTAFEADVRALGKVRLFVIIIAVCLLIGIASTVVFYYLVAIAAIKTAVSSGGSFSSFFDQFFVGIAVVAGIGIAVVVFALFQLRSAFKTLATVDRERFGVPSTLTLLLMIAEPLVLVGVAVSFGGLGSIIGSVHPGQQASANSSAIASSLISSGGLGLFITGTVLEGIAGLVAFIGLVGGPVLGLWRLGCRYDEGTIKAAAILYIIPLIQIVSPILLWIGVGSAMRKVSSAGPQGPPPNH